MIPNKELEDMKVIGLTGGIGSGKSTVSRMLRCLGAKVIDADSIAREVVEVGRPALDEIKTTFGEDYILPSGELDRKKLGSLVFGNKDKLDQLNGITHPRIMKEIASQIDQFKDDDRYRCVVVDCALLFEMKMEDLVEETWLVSLERKAQMERIMNRDQMTQEEAENRINAQMALSDKEKRASRIIDNSREVSRTHEQVLELWHDVVLNQES